MVPAIKKSRRSYASDLVRIAEPEHVFFIGKGIAQVVEPGLRRDFPERHTMLNQPNAHVSAVNSWQISGHATEFVAVSSS